MEMVNLIVSLNRYRSKFITQFIPIYTLLYYYLVYIYIFFVIRRNKYSKDLHRCLIETKETANNDKK